MIANVIDHLYLLPPEVSPDYDGPIGITLALLLVPPALAVSIRRLHDIDKSGWWVLLTPIPLIGLVFFVILGCLPGTKVENRFGSPLQSG